MTRLDFIKEFSSGEDFSRYTHDCTIKLDKISGLVTLADSMLLADEAGRALHRKGEELSRFVWARKEFILEDTAFRSVHLICYLYEHQGNSSPLYIEVNGHPLTLPANSGYQSWNIWYPIPVSPEYLKTGRNEIVFHSDGVCFDSWRLGLENGNLLDRSAKSIDGGQTWRYNLMGYDNSQKGEYLVRMRLGRFTSAGTVTSPVISLGPGEKIIKRAVVGGKVRVEAAAITPGGTEVTLHARLGRTPSPASDDWADWRPVTEDVWLDVTDQRFIQWKATLMTADPLVTPALEAVTIEGALELGEKPVGLSVEEFDRIEVVENSFPFTYQDLQEPKLTILRQREKLDQVIAGAGSEWEKFLLLRTWVSQQWRDVGEELYYCPWDALVILDWKRRLGNEARAACIHYAVTFCQCCLSLGLQARLVVLARRPTVHNRGHFVTEVWSNQHGKWIIMDPHLDIHYERDGVPLNALELHQIWMKGEMDSVVQVAGAGNVNHPIGSTWALDGFRDGLYHYWGLVLRNNHLTALDPGPMEHGAVTYRWPGFLWWGGSIPEELPQFPLHSSRVADFYWPLGSVAVDLQWEGEGTLLVHLTTCYPNLDRFEVQIDSASWEESEATFIWCLHSGQNNLRVRARNDFGISGRESCVTLAWESPDVTNRSGR